MFLFKANDISSTSLKMALFFTKKIWIILWYDCYIRFSKYRSNVIDIARNFWKFLNIFFNILYIQCVPLPYFNNEINFLPILN